MAEYSQLKQGDIVVMDFSPTKGHEQNGRRPALIVSIDDFYKLTGLVFVVPITSKEKDFGLIVELDDQTKTSGLILCQHMRSVDPDSRNLRFVEKCPRKTLNRVLSVTDKIFHQ